MNRPLYNKATRTASIARANFHASILHEVEQQIQQHDILMIAGIPTPWWPKAKALTKLDIPSHYLEYGGYWMWKERLAI